MKIILIATDKKASLFELSKVKLCDYDKIIIKGLDIFRKPEEEENILLVDCIAGGEEINFSVSDIMQDINNGYFKVTTESYKIQDREAGNLIHSGLTKSRADELLKQFEELDKKEGTYTPNFYEIVEE